LAALDSISGSMLRYTTLRLYPAPKEATMRFSPSTSFAPLPIASAYPRARLFFLLFLYSTPAAYISLPPAPSISAPLKSSIAETFHSFLNSLPYSYFFPLPALTVASIAFLQTGQ